MDPILIVLIAQTAVFTATLIVLILQVRNQVEATRNQVEATHLDVYSRCQADYSSLVRTLTQQGELRTIYDDLAKIHPERWRWTGYSDVEKSLYNYFELNYELFERVFVLWTRRWIDAETWKQWEVWLTEVCEHPIFADVCRENAGMFDSRFERHVNDKLQKLKSTQ